MQQGSSDQPDSFGWFSIGLHWFTAVAVTLIWFVGKSITLQSGAAVDERRILHVTMGLMLWLPLLLRILWRFRAGHPRARGQTPRTHLIARYTHYFMLALLGLMLLSGPLLAALLPQGGTLAGLLRLVHGGCANLLALLVLLHIAAALKHLMFHDDETIARIFIPRKPEPALFAGEAGAHVGNQAAAQQHAKPEQQ